MKKILVLCICIAILAIIFVFSGKGQYTKALQNLKVDDLDKIVIYNADERVTLDQKDDMQKMVDILTSMQLRETSPNTKDGFAFSMELYDHNGEETTIVVASSDVTVGDQNYKCKEDYCEQIRSVYEQYYVK